MKSTRKTLALAVLLVAAACSLRAHADDDDKEHAEREALRSAVERGEVKSLSEVLKMVSPELNGDIVDVEIEHEGGAWIYEFRVVGSDGRVTEAEVDAATGKIIEVEEK